MLYSTIAYGKTFEDVAEEFCRDFWDKPRKVKILSKDTFKCEEGTATYKIFFIPGIPLKTVDTYQVDKN